MLFKTPSFWYKQPGFLSFILTPASWVYQIIHRINQAIKPAPYTSSIPVICIGNAIAGGSGKTPTVISLVTLLKEKNKFQKPFILTRGYGGSLTSATLVDVAEHTSDLVGDEALLLARYAPTIMASNRADGAKLAEEIGADLIIMDDGLLNLSLHKTLSFLVVDRQMDFGNGKTLPAGPLREPLRRILPKVDSVICIGPSFHSDKPVFEAEIVADNKTDKASHYIAFAGLGLPDKFKNMLIDLDVNLVGWHAFPDHHVYTQKDIEQLRREASDKKSALITTEKDFVRLQEDLSKNIQTLAISMAFKEADEIASFIQTTLDGA